MHIENMRATPMNCNTGIVKSCNRITLYMVNNVQHIINNNSSITPLQIFINTKARM